MKSMFKKWISYIQSDINLKTETYWQDGVERIDGFRFYSKAPWSNSYQYHATIGIENTEKILTLIQNAISDKSKAVDIQISLGMGSETVSIWKGSFNRAEEQMIHMIEQIQNQK